MYRLALVVVALLACANAAVLPSAGRIIGGSAADITEAPYTAALLIDSTGSGVFSQGCGAVIVTRTAVITSAQCTPFIAARLRIRAGSTFHNSGGQVIQVSTIRNHESFSATTYNNDISILYLATQITLGSTASTVTLPAQGAAIVDGTNCLHYGWGRLTAGGTAPVNLYRGTLPVVNQALCTSAYSGINTVTTNMICVGRHGIGGVGPCQGDTGGPLINNGILYGISSWGRGCGEPNYPSVFTRIPMYRTWLNSWL